MTSLTEDYTLTASSNEATITQVMSSSQGTWSPTAKNVQDGSIWFKFTLDLDASDNYEAAINDIRFKIVNVVGVKVHYTFREIPHEDIDIQGGISITPDEVVIDAGVIAALAKSNVTAVKIILVPGEDSNPRIYNMDIRVCYFPKGE